MNILGSEVKPTDPLCPDVLPPNHAGGDGTQPWRITVSRPKLPPFERIAPYVRRIDAAHFYTNGGAISEEFRTRVAAHLGLQPQLVALASSGTAALTGLILARAGRASVERTLCICPSFTFAASAMAAQACGYTPWFADIDPDSWALDPAHVEKLPGLYRAGLVLVVAPFGRMVDLNAWQALRPLL